MEAGVAMKSRIEFWLSLRCLLYVQVEREAIAYTVLEFSKKKLGLEVNIWELSVYMIIPGLHTHSIKSEFR